jgi:hypothetical protein
MIVLTKSDLVSSVIVLLNSILKQLEELLMVMIKLNTHLLLPNMRVNTYSCQEKKAERTTMIKIYYNMEKDKREMFAKGKPDDIVIELGNACLDLLEDLGEQTRHDFVSEFIEMLYEYQIKESDENEKITCA